MFSSLVPVFFLIVGRFSPSAPRCGASEGDFRAKPPRVRSFTSAKITPRRGVGSAERRGLSRPLRAQVYKCPRTHKSFAKKVVYLHRRLSKRQLVFPCPTANPCSSPSESLSSESAEGGPPSLWSAFASGAVRAPSHRGEAGRPQAPYLET